MPYSVPSAKQQEQPGRLEQAEGAFRRPSERRKGSDEASLARVTPIGTANLDMTAPLHSSLGPSAVLYAQPARYLGVPRVDDGKWLPFDTPVPSASRWYQLTALVCAPTSRGMTHL